LNIGINQWQQPRTFSYQIEQTTMPECRLGYLL
jgi:hypothetical protein